MKINQSLNCPKCGSSHFAVKREAAYLYTYKLDTPDTEHWSWQEEMLPFLFDNREQTHDEEYLQCEECGAKYPCQLDLERSHIQLTILQKAIRSDYTEEPGFLG